MTCGWVSTGAHHRWMGVIALVSPVYVRTMGLVTVCFQIVIDALVVVVGEGVGVLKGLCEFAVMDTNQSSLFMIPVKGCVRYST